MSTWADACTHSRRMQGLGCYMFAIEGTNLVIDATLRGGVARFINHSCDVR